MRISGRRDLRRRRLGRQAARLFQRDRPALNSLDFYHDPTIGAFNTLKKDGLAFGLPVTVLVDENNCVVANMNGPAEWASEDAYRLIDAVKAKSD